MSELSKGIKTEREHADVVTFIESFHRKHGRFPTRAVIYKKIALGHLREDPKYYTKLVKYHL